MGLGSTLRLWSRVPISHDDDLVDIEDIGQAGRYVVACLIAVAVYNAVEMFPIVFFTFKRYSGLYFWAIISATMGVLISAAGLSVSDWDAVLESSLGTALNTFAWVLMVTGQSLVLFSRLHLVNISRRVRRWVLTMIIFNAITMHTPTAVLTIGARINAPGNFQSTYSYAERIQVTVFFIQELILSGIYLWKSFGVLESYRVDGGPRVRNQARGIILHLMLANIFVISLDVTIIVLEFMGLYVIQVSYKAFAYSVKLKCEIGILNRLVDFVKTTRPTTFRLNSQVEREWESTLRMTFGTSKDDMDLDEKPGRQSHLLSATTTGKLGSLTEGHDGHYREEEGDVITKAAPVRTPESQRAFVKLSRPLKRSN